MIGVSFTVGIGENRGGGGPGPATHFALTAGTPTAGVAINYTVTALDAGGRTAVSYDGTITWSCSDPAPATLPENGTLTDGVGVFSVTLKTAGSQNVVATDTTTPSIHGNVFKTVVAGVIFALLTTAPGSATAGTSITITVTALDAYGNTATGYAGTVNFTSTDVAATLPSSGTLTAGTRTFSATLKTAGTKTITATDATTGSIFDATSNITVSPAAIASITVVMSNSSPSAGQAITATVTALDAFSNVATGYTGTVHFTSTDGAATLPSNATLTSGTRTFTSGVTLKTSGTRTVTAADVTTSSIKGTSSNITVSAAALASFTVTGANSVVGESYAFTVEAKDAFNNRVTGYNGSPTLATDDPFDASGATITLSSGIASNFWGWRTAGTFFLSATDGSPTGSKTGIVVTEIPSFNFHDFGVTGNPRGFEVEALDGSGNRDTAYENEVTFSKVSGPGALTFTDTDDNPLPGNAYTFTGGDSGNKQLKVSASVSGDYVFRAVDASGFHGDSETVSVSSE